jgi:acetyltransferase EpsM
MKPVLILGTTPYAAVFIDSFEGTPGLEIAGCVENINPARCAEQILGRPIFWSDAIDDMAHSHDLICALATTKRAAWIENMAGRGFGFATLVHNSAVVSRRSTLGAGVAIDAGVVLAGFTEIEDHVRIGRRASIGHHSTIGRYATLHPGAIISGNCRIGAGVIIGSGAVLIDGIAIGAGAVVAAGAIVIKDVEAQVMVAGNPAQIKRPDYGPK